MCTVYVMHIQTCEWRSCSFLHLLSSSSQEKYWCIAFIKRALRYQTICTNLRYYISFPLHLYLSRLSISTVHVYIIEEANRNIDNILRSHVLLLISLFEYGCVFNFLTYFLHNCVWRSSVFSSFWKYAWLPFFYYDHIKRRRRRSRRIHQNEK